MDAIRRYPHTIRNSDEAATTPPARGVPVLGGRGRLERATRCEVVASS